MPHDSRVTRQAVQWRRLFGRWMMQSSGRETTYIELTHGPVEYRWVGPPPQRRPTLVLLHEGLGCVELWKDFPERLQAATGLGVFLYSRYGYGRSHPAALPRPLGYMHDEAVRYLGAVLDAAGVRRCILVGHSDGASIASIYAGQFADPRLLAMVLMAPHFFTEEICVSSIRRARRAYEREDLRDRLSAYHHDNVDCAFWGWNQAWLDPGFRDWSIEAYLPNITVPCLALQGKQDEYGTLKQITALQTLCGAAVEAAILPCCGHSPHRDQPDKTLDAITRFVDRVAKLSDRMA